MGQAPLLLAWPIYPSGIWQRQKQGIPVSIGEQELSGFGQKLEVTA